MFPFNVLPSFRKREFATRGGYPEIFSIAWPLVLMSASNSIMQFADRKFLAQYSTLDVAASMPAGILYFSLFVLLLVVANYTSAIVAQYHGAGDKTNLLRAVHTGQLFSIGAALVITFAIPPLGLLILRNSGHDAALISSEIDYFTGLLPSGAFICLAAPYFAFFSGRGRTRPVAVINIAGCILNVLLDYIMIFGKWGCPEFGIYGAAIGTSIACGFSMILIMVYFYLQDQKDVPTRAPREFHPQLLSRLVRFGVPAGFQTFCDVGAFTLVAFMVGYFGEAALAASVIALSINNLFFLPLMGLSDSTAILVGQYIGRCRHGVARSIAFRAWKISAVYMIAGVVLYLGFPDAIAEFFAPDAQGSIDFGEVKHIAVGVLALVTFFNACDCIKYVFMGAMRGAGDTMAIFLINCATAWGLLVPGVYFFSKVWPYSIYLVWGYVGLVAFIDAMLFLWRFNSGKWRYIRLIDLPLKH